MQIAELVLRWVHIMGAAMLVGMTIYMRTVYIPARDFASEKPGEDFSGHIRRIGARLVMVATAWLLISGLINFALLMRQYDVDKTYHMIFGIKFLLALILFFLAAATSGRSKLAQKLQKREKTWWTVNLVLAGLIVFLGAMLHFTDRTEKSETSARVAQPAVAFAEESPSGNWHHRIS